MSDGPAVIVVDDVQFARSAQPALFSFAQALPSRGPAGPGQPARPGVLGGQTPPGRGIVRAAGGRPGVLADEAAALFALVGLEPSAASDLDRLHALNEGWPAGLGWPRLPCGATPILAEVIDALASTTRAVNDYLLNEVLERLPANWSSS